MSFRVFISCVVLFLAAFGENVSDQSFVAKIRRNDEAVDEVDFKCPRKNSVVRY